LTVPPFVETQVFYIHFVSNPLVVIAACCNLWIVTDIFKPIGNTRMTYFKWIKLAHHSNVSYAVMMRRHLPAHKNHM